MIEDLSPALRGILLLDHDRPDGASLVAEIEEAKAFHTGLSSRDVSVADRIPPANKLLIGRPPG